MPQLLDPLSSQDLGASPEPNEKQPAGNYAPGKALKDLQKSQPTKQLTILEFAKPLRDEMRKEKESSEWQRRILSSQRNELFYKGLQRLRRADLGNTWRILEPKPIHYTLNEFAFWCNTVVSKWINSRIDFRVTSLDDLPDKEAAAKKILQVVRHYEDRDWTRTEIISASKQCQFEGYLVGYVFHDPTYDDRKAFRPVFERQVLSLGNNAYRCADCGVTGEIPESSQELEQPAQCVECGSPNVVVTEVPPVDIEQQVGEEQVDTGDVAHKLISIYNITWKARRGLQDSDIVLWEAEYQPAELEVTYPGIDLPQTGNTSFALNALAALENAGQGRSNAHNTGNFVLSRMWVEPTRYAQVELKEDVDTLTMGVISKGTMLKDIFPNGLHIILCADTIVDLYPAVKNDDLCVMEYHSNPHGLARGADDMCEPQRQSNTAHSLMNVWMRHSAMPPMTYVDGVIEPGDLSGDLTKPIPIKGANLGMYDGVTAENALIYRQGQVMQPGIFQYAEKLRSAIQLAANETSFAAGLPDADNKTLGGAQIGQTLAQSISGVILAQFADFRVEIAKRKLKKFKEYCWDDRYIQFSGQYGAMEGKLLSAIDIPENFKLETVPNSWLPRIPEQQQANMQAVLAVVGGIPGLQVAPPELLAELCEIYDVNLTQNNYPIAIRTARSRINQAKELIPMMQQLQEMVGGLAMESGLPPEAAQPVQADPMTGMPIPVSPGQQILEALQPSFNPREEGHEIAAQYLSKWFTTDEGLQAPPELVDFVGCLQDAHLQAIILQNQVKVGLQMSAQPPQPQGSDPAQKGQPSPPKEKGLANHPSGG